MPAQQSEPEQPSRVPSLLTLAIACAASVVAALVVSRIWGPGTLIGAAATPVIITLVSEALKKPAEVITVVRTPTGTQVHEAAPPREREVAPDDLRPGDEVVAAPASASRRPALLAALATGLVAFVIGAFLLTGGELVFGDSAVSGGDRTTLLGGKAKQRTVVEETVTQTVTTQTETVPPPTSPTVTETTPPTVTRTVPAPTAPTGPSGPTSP